MGAMLYVIVTISFTAVAWQFSDSQLIAVTECGSTYGCFLESDTCGDNCLYTAMYKLNGDMIDGQVTVRGGKEWIAIGFNPDNAMAGTKGILCQSNNGSVIPRVFHNTAYAVPTLLSTSSSNVITRNAQHVNGVLSCGFSFPYNGNANLHNLNTSDTRYGIMAWGIIAPGTTTIQKHAAEDILHMKIVITSKTKLYKGEQSKASLVTPGCFGLITVITIITSLMV